MQHSFWIEKWRKAQIGFHRSKPHPALEKYFPSLSPNATVLVPLCGKSNDLLWLAGQGYQVYGVELVESAVLDFFTENNLDYTRTDKDQYVHFQTTDGNIHLIVGDFLSLEPEQFPQFNALYDRAALIALPPDMRVNYVKQCQSLVERDARVLLISFSYDQSVMQGPPFSVPENEIEQLWQSRLKLADSHDLIDAEPRFKERGLSAMYEQTWTS